MLWNRGRHFLIPAAVLLLVGLVLFLLPESRSAPGACLAILQSGQALYQIDEKERLHRIDHPRCDNPVPLISGRFREAESGGIDDSRARDLIRSLHVMRRAHPGLFSRLSELKMSDTGLTFYIDSPRIRVDAGPDLDRGTMERILAALSYLEKEKKGAGVIDLRGPEAMFFPQP